MTIQKLNIDYVPVADILRTVAYLDEAGDPVDLTTATTVLKVYEHRTDELLLTLTTSDNITITTPTNGQITFKITPAQLATLKNYAAYYVLTVGFSGVAPAILTGNLNNILL